MRRRPPAVTVPAAPGHLVRFDPDDWPVGPEPWDWAARMDEYPWRIFSAGLQWQRARRAWVVEQGDTPEAREAVHSRALT